MGVVFLKIVSVLIRFVGERCRCKRLASQKICGLVLGLIVVRGGRCLFVGLRNMKVVLVLI